MLTSFFPLSLRRPAPDSITHATSPGRFSEFDGRASMTPLSSKPQPLSLSAFRMTKQSKDT